MTSTTCPYVLLGLPTTASEQEIKRAYRVTLDRIRASIDRTGPDAPVHQFDAARRAYKLLTDAEQRQRYDAERLAGQVVAKRLAAAAAVDQEYRLAFDGNGKVYFRIWITNLLLSLLTLGIYSAWAKVRREQYFHRHLRVDGVAFDYHADPKAILRGRIIFFLIVGAYSLTRFMPPALGGLVTLGAVLLFPWMIVRSLQFRAANTSYRGLRFTFRGRYREAVSVYLGYGLLSLLTLGLALPLMLWRQKHFAIGQLAYGANSFGFYATRAMFYRALWLPTLLIFALFGGLVGGLVFFGKSFVFVMTMLVVSKLIIPWLILTFLVINLLLIPYARMRALNVAWSNTRINEVRFNCDQRFTGYGATHVSNWLMMILSLGLFWPWAVVRMLQYRVAHFGLRAPESLDEFIAGRQKNPSALGGEAAASLDLDVGL